MMDFDQVQVLALVLIAGAFGIYGMIWLSLKHAEYHRDDDE